MSAQPTSHCSPQTALRSCHGGWLRRRTAILVTLAFLASVLPGQATDQPLTEPQVKALFLFNFAKYVDWPAAAFADSQAPIVIGLLGDTKLSGPLEQAVQDKTIAGRSFRVQRLEKAQDCHDCQILFISASEKKNLPEILNQIKTLPILTVGESDQFAQQGGIIGFVKKEGKVRLEIDLNAARQAKLQISSKLLSVADSVSGKP
jgi:hypothetical protein